MSLGQVERKIIQRGGNRYAFSSSDHSLPGRGNNGFGAGSRPGVSWQDAIERENYFATQTIYYPGFTIGASAEPAGIVATLILVLLTPHESPAFPWTLAAFIAIAAMHAVYWTVTHPVNGFWVKDIAHGAGRRFFSVGLKQRLATGAPGPGQWEQLRNTWEHSHMVRAVLAAISFVALAVANAVYGRG